MTEENRCDDCQQPVTFEFHVPASLWTSVVDPSNTEVDPTGYCGGAGYLCLNCFTLRALSKGISEFTVNDIVS